MVEAERTHLLNIILPLCRGLGSKNEEKRLARVTGSYLGVFFNKKVDQMSVDAKIYIRKWYFPPASKTQLGAKMYAIRVTDVLHQA